MLGTKDYFLYVLFRVLRLITDLIVKGLQKISI